MLIFPPAANAAHIIYFQIFNFILRRIKIKTKSRMRDENGTYNFIHELLKLQRNSVMNMKDEGL